jgi:acyl-CoA synthetase (NDP forming)
MKAMLAELCRRAAAEGRDTLLEVELYDLLAAGGIAVPQRFLLGPEPGRWEAELGQLDGDRVVLKVVSPEITHKTEVGGVAVVENRVEAILAGARAILDAVHERGGAALAATIRGILVTAFVPGEPALGGQLLAGLRWTPDMGHVVTIGLGGLDAEEMAQKFNPGEATVLYSPELMTPAEGLAKFSRSFAYRRVTGKTRDGRILAGDEELLRVLTFLGEVTDFSNGASSGLIIREFEVNPFFVADGRLVAVDAFLRFEENHVVEDTADLDKLRRLLQPQTAAIVGVSERSVNVGRVILRNLLREHYPVDQMRVIRTGCSDIDGVRCVDSIADLPWVAELLVVAVGAQQVPAVVREVLETQKATGIVIVAGGMGETEEGKAEEAEIRQMVLEARGRGDWAPVIVGPNCLGIRSKKGRYDTLFIPESKLPRPEGKVRNSALICQSGAFMITRMNGLDFMDPAYAISTGNQMDLTLTDFVELVIEDDSVDVLALYIEGFNALDGLRLAKLVREARARGKDVLVYKAGRTSQGLTATSSHTASISSDYLACTEVLRDAGAYISYSFRELKATLAVASLLHRREFRGLGIGAISNAGFETVGMADTLAEDLGFSLPDLAPETRRKIRKVLEDTKIESLVNIRNPLDLTPMAPDRVYAECLDALLSDPNIEAVIMGIVPLTPALMTLPPGTDKTGWDSIDNPLALHNLLPPIIEKHNKPVVTSADGGRLYDALEDSLHLKGLPCFRTADFAMKTFQRYLGYRFRQGLSLDSQGALRGHN